MQGEEGLPEVATSGEDVVELSKQSMVDLRWGLHVGDIVQLTLGVEKKRSYAIYCGQGRVIHSWSPSRRNFRVRVDPLRTLMLAGYMAVACSKAIDIFFQALLALTPVAPPQVVQRAKTALHANTTSRSSSLSLILFARYGDRSFEVLESLKGEYSLAHEAWTKGVTPNIPLPSFDDNLLLGGQATKSHSPIKRESPGETTVEQSTLETPIIEAQLGSCGEYLLSEWLRRSLRDFIMDPGTVNCWYAIGVPPGFIPLFLMYDKGTAEFTIRFQLKGGLPERLAGDRMECGYDDIRLIHTHEPDLGFAINGTNLNNDVGNVAPLTRICWTDFTTLKVMIMKCSHYICAPCLRLLPRSVCPYCREPIRCAFEITEQAKQEALRLMLESTSLERSVTIATVAELDLETDPAEVEENGDDNSDEPEPNPPMDDQVEAPVDQVDEPEADS